MYRLPIIALITILFANFLSAQINLATNFDVNTPQPVDTRDTLTTLADTSLLSATEKYPGLLTFVRGLNKYYYVDTLLNFKELTTGGGSTTIITGGGGLPSYSIDSTYVVYQLVTSDGEMYSSRKSNNINNPLTNKEWWNRISFTGIGFDAYPNTPDFVGGNLRDWQARKNQKQNDRKPLSLILLGDSNTESASSISPMTKKMLQSKYGPAGPGLITFKNIEKHVGVFWDTMGVWGHDNLSWDNYSLNGHGDSWSTGEGIQLFMTGDSINTAQGQDTSLVNRCDSLVVFVYDETVGGGGTLEIRSTKPAITQDFTTVEGWNSFHLDLQNYGLHDITATNTGVSDFYVLGLWPRVKDERQGIVIHRLGHSGGTATDLSGVQGHPESGDRTAEVSNDLIRQQLKVLDPDCILFNIGTNSGTAENALFGLDTLVKKYRIADTTAQFVILQNAEKTPNGTYDADQVSRDSGYYQIAVENNGRFGSIGLLLGEKREANYRGLYSQDTPNKADPGDITNVHFTAEGSAVIADYIVNDLLQENIEVNPFNLKIIGNGQDTTKIVSEKVEVEAYVVDINGLDSVSIDGEHVEILPEEGKTGQSLVKQSSGGVGYSWTIPTEERYYSTDISGNTSLGTGLSTIKSKRNTHIYLIPTVNNVDFIIESIADIAKSEDSEFLDNNFTLINRGIVNTEIKAAGSSKDFLFGVDSVDVVLLEPNEQISFRIAYDSLQSPPVKRFVASKPYTLGFAFSNEGSPNPGQYVSTDINGNAKYDGSNHVVNYTADGSSSLFINGILANLKDHENVVLNINTNSNDYGTVFARYVSGGGLDDTEFETLTYLRDRKFIVNNINTEGNGNDFTLNIEGTNTFWDGSSWANSIDIPANSTYEFVVKQDVTNSSGEGTVNRFYLITATSPDGVSAGSTIVTGEIGQFVKRISGGFVSSWQRNKVVYQAQNGTTFPIGNGNPQLIQNEHYEINVYMDTLSVGSYTLFLRDPVGLYGVSDNIDNHTLKIRNLYHGSNSQKLKIQSVGGTDIFFRGSWVSSFTIPRNSEVTVTILPDLNDQNSDSEGIEYRYYILQDATSANLKGSAALDFPSTAAHSSSSLTMTVTGADVSEEDTVEVIVPTELSTGFFRGYVSADNEVTVVFHNLSTGAVDPANGSYQVVVRKN